MVTVALTRPDGSIARPKIVMRGDLAIESGRPLWVLGFDGWHPEGSRTRERATKMLGSHATWIYGVEAVKAVAP